jgi:hypothetical protein
MKLRDHMKRHRNYHSVHTPRSWRRISKVRPRSEVFLPYSLLHPDHIKKIYTQPPLPFPEYSHHQNLYSIPPPIIRYVTYPNNHQHKVHLIELDEFTPSESLLGSLSMGFKFIPKPIKHYNRVYSWFTAYSKHAKPHLESFVKNVAPQGITSPPPLPPEQEKIASLLKSKEWRALHEKHILSMTDKNLDVAIVSHKWMIKHATKLLTDATVFTEVIPPLPIEEIARQFSEEIPFHIPTLPHLITTPTPTKVAHFYPFPRPHKGLPVPARPITSASYTVTTYLSNALDQLFQTILRDVHTKLKGMGRLDLFTVITNTEQAIHKAQEWLAKRADDYTQLSAYDFTNMYTNIDTDASIESILWIIQDFLGLPPTHKISINIWRTRPNFTPEGLPNFDFPINSQTSKPLRNLPILTNIKIPVQWVGKLINMVLRQFSYVESEWLPGRQFRQIKGYAMGTNCAPTGANLTLLAQEIHYYQHFQKEAFFCRFIDDILCAHAPDEDPTIVMKEIYGPLSLTFSKGTSNPNPFGGVERTVFLDLQFPSLQLNSFHFGLYSKPLNAYGMFHLKSYAPRSIAKGVVIGAALRILARNSHPANAQADWILYSKLLNRQGYSNAFIMSTLLKYGEKIKGLGLGLGLGAVTLTLIQT